MAARLSAKKLPRYSFEFKRKAVKLTQVPGMEVQAVAKGLDIHPVMLSRWRQEAREGRLRGKELKPRISKKLVRELKRLQALGGKRAAQAGPGSAASDPGDLRPEPRHLREPRVQHELAGRGVAVSRRRVEGLMRAAGMRARAVVIYRSQRAMNRHYR
jgi:transposase-like protein